MLEVYLFINPLGNNCLRCEHDIVKLDDQIDQKVIYQFVPVLNMQTINHTLEFNDLDIHDLTVRNRVSKAMFQIILDYKAALFQGRKKGRRFLLRLQDSILKNNMHYSEELTFETAETVNLDIDMFSEDRSSRLAHQAFETDQKMANEMGIDQTSSAVIYNADNTEYGVLINDFTYDSLLDLCNKSLDSEPTLNSLYKTTNYHPNLRVL